MSPHPIRAIVGRFSYDFSRRSLEEAIKQKPFSFCALLSADDRDVFVDGVPFDQQQLFRSSEIRNCEYRDIDWNAVAPIDAELIEQMRDCEATFFAMVSRLEWKRIISYDTRKRWYLKHLQFWNDYLTRHEINLYISAWLPHEIPDIVIYHLCKLRKIPILYFHSSSVRDISFAEHDIEKSAEQIAQTYEKLVREYKDETDPLTIPLTPLFAERYDALIAPEGQKPPLENLRRATYADRIRTMIVTQPLQFARFAVGYLTPKGIARARGSIQRWRSIRARDTFYDAHAIEPNLDQPFVYFPLHFQPEASTVPMGGIYADQILVARLLQKHLPKDVLIYVKEHAKPSSWLCRTVDSYKELLELPNVRLVHRKTKTFALREKCMAVATVTGTAGFEGLFRGKPVLLFGHRFYQYARGVFRIRAEHDLEKAIKQIVEKKAAPTLVEARLYLKAMEETGVKGTLNPWHRKVSALSDDEHIKANSEAIVGELDHLMK